MKVVRKLLIQRFDKVLITIAGVAAVVWLCFGNHPQPVVASGFDDGYVKAVLCKP